MACRDCIKKNLMIGRDITTSKVSDVISENKDLFRGNQPMQIRIKGSQVVLIYEDECFSATLTRTGWRPGAADTIIRRDYSIPDRVAARKVARLFDKVRSELRTHA